MPSEKVKTTLMISEENMKRLKYKSADDKKPVSDVLDEILSEYFRKQSK